MLPQLSSRSEAALAGLAGLDAAGVREQQSTVIMPVQHLRGEAALLLFDAA